MFGEAIPYRNMQQKINIINRLKKLKKKLKYVKWDVEDGFIVYQVIQKIDNDIFNEIIQENI